ncbi:MAG: PIG-L family deacetylase [Acidobacteria bacterium]|nr:PIG-L family deacetylase [Acidobacteriota bacterium]
MLRLSLNGAQAGPFTVLCLGSHSDDIEIGCGGILLTLAGRHPHIQFHWVVFSGDDVRKEEALRGVQLFTCNGALKNFIQKDFPDGFLPFVGAEVKELFEQLKRAVSPDLVFTHYRNDAHQDHRLLSDLTWNTFRDHLILEYEIPKYDGDMGAPNLFAPLEAPICERKVESILSVFQSQQGRQWFQKETFFSLMRLRGMECNSPSGYAEAFYCRKLVL